MGKTSKLAAKLPKSIRITRLVTYDIKLVKSFPDDHLQVGKCCPITHVISVKMKLSNKETAITLIHEVLEAINFEYDMKIPHWIIDALETPIYKIFKFNGWLK